jgi:hypothetical protein
MSARRRQLAPLHPVRPSPAPAEEQPAGSLSEFCSAGATLVSAVSGRPAAESILPLVVCALSSGVPAVPFGESSSLESLRPCNIRMRFALTNKNNNYRKTYRYQQSFILIILGADLKINGPEINVLHINRIILKEAIITSNLNK